MTHFTHEDQYTVNVHAEDGSYWAEVVEVPGCFVSGDSMEEIETALVEAMGLYLSSKNVTVVFHELKMVGPLDDRDGTERYEVTIPA